MKSSKKDTILGKLNVYKADRFFSRLKGLLFREKLGVADCIIIDPCGSIHTIGMGYSIHIIFLSNDYTILKVRNNLPPNRFCIGPSRSSKVVEFSSEFQEIPLTVIGKKFIGSGL